MKIVYDGDGSSQNNDVSSITSNGADPKRSVDGPILKVEPGLQSLGVMSPGGASSIPNIETPGSTRPPDEEFKPNAVMKEMIINFLIRIAKALESVINELGVKKVSLVVQ
nr:transformation/transcription domain-associated protein isoform X2 [Tanacetum cinerariifolium]